MTIKQTCACGKCNLDEKLLLDYIEKIMNSCTVQEFPDYISRIQLRTKLKELREK